MLVALELAGFKSFADETRFDFPPGITIVVGPNGSGKSNIVDAMKWVLGEQSARSLRGKEMADVIFKGSGAGDRKPANTAEATIVFENANNVFGVDAQEVRVTRRVYRSGEGEYLINNQPCRLRDIKDMFRGTGVGTDAYSLIEQGKVDSLLQASPRDRRAIFEEAAGISRFKAKKVEAQRRLERVEQNLLRLSDIVDEVGDRLKRLKSQAGKARRYKELADRLQELRTQVGRVDWQQLSARLQELERDEAGVRRQIAHCGTSREAAEAAALELETAAAQVDEGLRDCQSRSTRTRTRMAARQTTVNHELARREELVEEMARHRRQLLAMSSRADDLHTQAAEALAEHARAEHEHAGCVQAWQQAQQSHSHLRERLDGVRQAMERYRGEHLEAVQTVARLQQLMDRYQSQIMTADAVEQRLGARKDLLRQGVEQLAGELERIDQSLAQLAEQHARDFQALELKQDQRTASDRQLLQLRNQLTAQRRRMDVMGERQTLLQEFEERMEGVGRGVQQLLALAHSNDDGPWHAVRGMVADLVQVADHTLAEMIAVALGERAQYLVVAGAQFFDRVSQGKLHVPGRVGFLRLQSSAPPRPARGADLDGQQGVIARADRVVRCEEEYEHLVQWLLGDTWLVESLEDALQFRRSLPVAPRFVTRRGELLSRDGSLLAGPILAEATLITRRSELEQLARQLAAQQQLIEADSAEEQRLESAHTALGDRVRELSQAVAAVDKELSGQRRTRESTQLRWAEMQQQEQTLEAELAEARGNRGRAGEALVAAQAELEAAVRRISELDLNIERQRTALEQLEAEDQAQVDQVTRAQVAMAKSEQRLDGLAARQTQLQRDQAERDRALEEVRGHVDQAQRRCGSAELEILRANSELADLFLAEEQFRQTIKTLTGQAQELRQQRSQQARQLGQLRDQQQAAEQDLHRLLLEADRIRHERQGLAERLREDYGVDLADLQRDLSSAERQERQEVDAEIAELRRKITNLGAVNMDALEELTDLESRFGSLHAQYEDLVRAKESLERVIQKINADSRRLFAETLEAIRKNFQVLFRKVFGGGQADIVLEEGVDILESGIDVVATPPGKQSLGLSLLSGGERALTAVTLLLAIFEYRPSPFCVLDEVDGPLDEANIGRFVEVLREFLQWTKFVVVTHSKKTMAAAHTLYGVTMQESGVSKRVSVRFEDVNEHGEINVAALQRPDEPLAAGASSGGRRPPAGSDELGAA